MEDLYKIPENELAMTTRALVPILKERGYKVEVIRGKDNFLHLTRSDGKEFFTYSYSPPDTSYFAGCIADDKLASYFLLRDIPGVKQPDTLYVKSLNDSQSLAEFLDAHKKVVIKPVDGAHGNDVYTDVTTIEDAERKISFLLKERHQRVIVQQQLETDGHETRVVCVGYKFVAAFSRIPASVTGDGIHTVSELVKIENATIRTEPYASNLAYIDEKMAEEYLAENNLADYIPKLGEKVRVVMMCNIGRGGTVVNITSQILDEIRRLCESIAEKLQLPIVGIDFLGDYILEVNSTPCLFYPTNDGSSTVCVRKMVDHLDQL